jgi:DNA-binding MarR family transcriptional regulator
MSIDKDILTANFRNANHKALVNLLYTHSWISERTRVIFDRADLTPQQYNILRILRGAKKPLSTLQIRQRMIDKMSDTSRIVDRLIAKHLVKKTVCESDKRLVDVIITPEGLKLLDELEQFNNEMDSLLNNLNADEVEQLNSLLDKIREPR